MRELLESNPDLDRNKLNELVYSDAQLKDLYDSRPELKEILLTRAKLHEDERRRQRARFGSAPARPRCLLSVRLAAPGPLGPPQGEAPATGRPSHRLGCSSEPPPKLPILLPATI